MSDPRPSDTAAGAGGNRLWFVFIPLVVFAALAVIFVIGLGNKDPQKIPSVLIGKPVPEFDLPAIAGLMENGSPVPGLTSAVLRDGKVRLVNVWASWCPPCRQEHPYLMKLAKDKSVIVTGINYKDKPANAKRFLATHGNPFQRIGADLKGRSAVDWGVIAAPETFLIDRNGIIRYKWIGPIDAKALESEVLPRVRALQGGN